MTSHINSEQKIEKKYPINILLSVGLHIVYTKDEVDVVQNLMFYIEAAYKVAVSCQYEKSLHAVSEQNVGAPGKQFVCVLQGMVYGLYGKESN